MQKKIPVRASNCAQCSRVFQRGDSYVSQLSEDTRRDYCSICWEKADFSDKGQFWHGKIPEKSEKKMRPDERALEFFQIGEDPKELTLLALYLQRRGQVVKRKGSLYEIPETGEVIFFEPVSLTPQESEEITARLIERLDE